MTSLLAITVYKSHTSISCLTPFEIWRQFLSDSPTLTQTEALMHSAAFPLYHTSCNTFHRPSLFALSYAFTRSTKATNGLQCLSQAFSVNHSTIYKLDGFTSIPTSSSIHLLLHLRSKPFLKSVYVTFSHCRFHNGGLLRVIQRDVTKSWPQEGESPTDIDAPQCQGHFVLRLSHKYIANLTLKQPAFNT